MEVNTVPHTYRAAALAIFAIALGGCAPATPEGEQPEVDSPDPTALRSQPDLLTARARDSIQVAIGTRYMDALVRLDSLYSRIASTDSTAEAFWEGKVFDNRDELQALRDEAARRLAAGDRDPDTSERLRMALVRFDSLLATVFALDAEVAELDSLLTLAGERFALFTECAPVLLGAPFGPTDWSGELHRGNLSMAENRLRVAGIWGGRDDFAAASAFRPVVTIAIDAGRASIWRDIWDPPSGEFGKVETWELNSWGLDPARRAVDLLDIELADEQARARELVSAYLDAFILDYLRVNEGYCQ